MIDWESDPELSALRREFAASFKRRREALASIVARLGPHGESPIRLGEAPASELRIVAHNLAGAAPTYGFESLGRVANEIDDRLSREGSSLPASELLQDALRLDRELISGAEFPVSGAKS